MLEYADGDKWFFCVFPVACVSGFLLKGRNSLLRFTNTSPRRYCSQLPPMLNEKRLICENFIGSIYVLLLCYYEFSSICEAGGPERVRGARELKKTIRNGRLSQCGFAYMTLRAAQWRAVKDYLHETGLQEEFCHHMFKKFQHIRNRWQVLLSFWKDCITVVHFVHRACRALGKHSPRLPRSWSQSMSISAMLPVLRIFY